MIQKLVCIAVYEHETSCFRTLFHFVNKKHTLEAVIQV